MCKKNYWFEGWRTFGGHHLALAGGLGGLRLKKMALRMRIT